jgi:uncharacterized OB-fold protein
MTISEDQYLPESIVQIFPDQYTRDYWDRTARGELAFQRCAQCKTFRHPPGPICPNCSSFEAEWHTVEGKGTIYSWEIVTLAVNDDLADYVPFNVVLVEFPDAPGVRLVTNCVDASKEDLYIGMPVEVIYQKYSTATLPRVKKA